MNGFDSTIISFFNQYAQVAWKLDAAVIFISENSLLKGTVLVTLLWWSWFIKSENQHRIRKHVISVQLGCLIAIMAARSLSLALPFRPRPIYNESLEFLLPHGMFVGYLQGWSSFPSDHAVLFFPFRQVWYLYQKRSEYSLWSIRF